MREEINDHKFAIGREYAVLSADKPENYLQVALQAEKFLAQNVHETEEGIFWQKSDAKNTDLTFYSGSSGVLYYYLKLAETISDAGYRTIAEKGTNYLAAHWRDFLSAPPTLGLGTEKGLYFGLGGVGLVLGEAFRVLHNQRAAEAAKEIMAYYQEIAITDESGTHWTDSTALAMDGGIILLFLQQYKLFRDKKIKETILSAGRAYLSRGKRLMGGGIEYNGCEGLSLPFSMPNFEFGSSGAGYLLTLLYDFTGDTDYLEAAKGTAAYLKKISVKQKKGYLIPHDVYVPTSETPIFYLSSCHGPAGTAKLFYRLYQLTGEVQYMDEIHELVDGLESLGAPEKQSAGLWNNVCLCCGHAGLVQFFVGLYQADGNERWHNLAVRSANVLLGEKEILSDGEVTWPMAWERINPDSISTSLGYYDGTAGVASALLQIYLSERGKFHWNRLPDDPFPENGD